MMSPVALVAVARSVAGKAALTRPLSRHLAQRSRHVLAAPSGGIALRNGHFGQGSRLTGRQYLMIWGTLGQPSRPLGSETDPVCRAPLETASSGVGDAGRSFP